MDQPGAVIESELLDLTGVTLEDIRARRDPERDEMAERLLHSLSDSAVSLAQHGSPSWTM